MKVDKKMKSVKQIDNRIKGKFKKGQSGNPNGRPTKDICIPNILRELLNKLSIINPKLKQTRLQAICSKAIDMAEDGDKDARNWIAERTEGKPIQPIGIEGGIEITINDMLNED